jgi:hypothetical protein
VFGEFLVDERGVASVDGGTGAGAVGTATSSVTSSAPA